MNITKRNKWTREETILAFELYCTIPSSKVTINNEQIIMLATAINRTSNSIKLKLQNFKSYDPSYTQDGRLGLNHGSKLDEQICNEFLNDWDSLVNEAISIKEKLHIINPELQGSFQMTIPTGYDKITETKIRIGQNFFRKALLASYSSKCCITELPHEQLLRASHIKPWSQTDNNNEKTNPKNGLLLNALHDVAFDKGLITINNDFKVILSTSLRQSIDQGTYVFFKKYEGIAISLPDKFIPDKQFIDYHNDMIFKG